MTGPRALESDIGAVFEDEPAVEFIPKIDFGICSLSEDSAPNALGALIEIDLLGSVVIARAPNANAWVVVGDAWLSGGLPSPHPTLVVET